MTADIKRIQKQIMPILKKYPITKAGLFGSVARGEMREDSDIDILVELEEKSQISLLDFVGIQLELEDKLHRKVDLVEYDYIKPALKEYILPTEVRIYEKDS